MKCIVKLSMILSIAVGAGWSLNLEHSKPQIRN